MSLSSTKEILSGKIAIGEKVTVAGWIRTRRDSKAGFSFLAVNDGSGFDNVQVIAPNTLNNYESEILKLTTGCSVVVDGTLKASEGKGQAYESMQTKYLSQVLLKILIPILCLQSATALSTYVSMLTYVLVPI